MLLFSYSLQLNTEDSSNSHLGTIGELLEVINDSLATSRYLELQSNGIDLLESTYAKVPRQVESQSSKVVLSLRTISTENSNVALKDKAKALLRHFE